MLHEAGRGACCLEEPWESLVALQHWALLHWAVPGSLVALQHWVVPGSLVGLQNWVVPGSLVALQHWAVPGSLVALQHWAVPGSLVGLQHWVVPGSLAPKSAAACHLDARRSGANWRARPEHGVLRHGHWPALMSRNTTRERVGTTHRSV